MRGRQLHHRIVRPGRRIFYRDCDSFRCFPVDDVRRTFFEEFTRDRGRFTGLGRCVELRVGDHGPHRQ
jgi:hypothetical protein